MTNIVERLTKFVQRVFKTNLDIFLDALKLSPNAQGYVSGSITELLLKKKLEAEYKFEVKRIREKWEGRKHPNHHGDFYFQAPNSGNWYVMESKGVKSNSEKWHKLYNYERLKRFLIANADKISWVNSSDDIEHQIVNWLQENLPKFLDDYSSNLYEYEEVQDYLANPPKRETAKLKEIRNLAGLSREQINHLVDERLQYAMSKVRVLETHFVSGTSGASERTQATPRKDEFNVVAVDIFLRYPEHKFVFANPRHLESSGDDPNHLQQNYIMGFAFPDPVGNISLDLTEEWYDNLMDVYKTFSKRDSVKIKEMQVDNRYTVIEKDDDE